MAIDDHSRVSFATIKPDETTASCVQFLRQAASYYASLGVRIDRVMTDNGAGYKTGFKAVCDELGIRYIRTRPHTSKTNGKAERFVQTSLREWAHVSPYEGSAQRAVALQAFLDYYNGSRPHSALNHQPPHGSNSGHKQPHETQQLAAARQTEHLLIDRERRALCRAMSMVAVKHVNGWHLFVDFAASASRRAAEQAVAALSSRYRVICFGRQRRSGGDSSLSTPP